MINICRLAAKKCSAEWKNNYVRLLLTLMTLNKFDKDTVIEDNLLVAFLHKQSSRKNSSRVSNSERLAHSHPNNKWQLYPATVRPSKQWITSRLRSGPWTKQLGNVSDSLERDHFTATHSGRDHSSRQTSNKPEEGSSHELTEEGITHVSVRNKSKNHKFLKI